MRLQYGGRSKAMLIFQSEKAIKCNYKMFYYWLRQSLNSRSGFMLPVKTSSETEGQRHGWWEAEERRGNPDHINALSA